MVQFKISAAPNLFLYFALSVTLIAKTTEADVDESYNATYCPNNSGTYSSNSTYRTNLNQLLSWLSSNASTHENGYYNTTIIGVNDRDTIYGAFLCRGDLTTNACQDCVSSASKILLQECPKEKEAVIWLDECMVRYSGQSFFSVAAEGPPLYTYYGPKELNQSSSMELLSQTMKAAVDLAADGGDEKKFGTKEANLSSFQTLYTLAQCTPDLTQLGCRECLGVAVGELPLCCNGQQGARILVPSCNIRYALFPFYSSQVAVPVVPPTPQEQPRLNSEAKSQISAVVIIEVVAPIVLALLVTFIAVWIKCPRASGKKHGSVLDESDQISSAELLQFEYDTIIGATNNFCDDNKLGEGGFGSVYKGILSNGQDIAVKRLSRNSSQGVNEFKNEVFLVGKLQHKNLVRLLGFCLNREEKMLIYEFVPNKSLDHFLFDPNKQQHLNWTRRYKIIKEIIRGMHYLHEDSPLKIIHRDIKASNILLDENLNPKISDFGMARIFYGDQTHGITKRVVGTIGYLPPEYMICGHFSFKVDVYSFGVLVLEIISGKKITSFYEPSHGGNLLNYAWKHFRDGTALELLDTTLRDSYSSDEVLRCIHIGLSCVQDDPAQRPTMQTIALMLNSHSVALSAPERPAGYFSGQAQPSLPTEPTAMATNKPVLASASVDGSSITNVYPR